MQNNDIKETYIIGEIGQNHNGSVDIAKLITDLVTRPIVDDLFDLPIKPINAVKLTKRDLRYELTDSANAKPYTGVNSFGATYGEHRAFLELSDEEHFEIYKHAKSLGLDFVETLCAISCIDMFKYFTPDKLKVASRDLTNLPLLDALGETKIPIIISTGMANDKDLNNALEVLTKHHSDISILHCVSEYPTNPNNLNLNTIPYLIENYPDYTIGFSDHTIGICAPVVAVGMGAKIIEKHITIDRNMRGTDQKGSLGPDGVKRMVRDIRTAERWMGKKGIFVADGVAGAREKLERSIATKRNMKAGEIVTEDDIHVLSPGNGYKWADRAQVIGSTLISDIPKNEIIYQKHLSS